MKILEEKLGQELKSILADKFDLELSEKQIQFQKTKKEFAGDITLVVFPLVKVLKTTPEKAANQIGEALNENSPLVREFNVVKGFLNLSIDLSFWLKELNVALADKDFGKASASGKSYMVEYSSPNTNKPLHLGHLRNNFLGYSVSEILKANGHEVIKTQIINDRGIHICKSMIAWQNFGEGETPLTSGLKGDKLVGKYYVKFDAAYKQEIVEVATQLAQDIDVLKGTENVVTLQKELIAKGKNDVLTEEDKSLIKAIKPLIEKAEKEAPIFKAAQAMLLKWEAKDPEVYALWQTMNGWVYAGFESTYKTMGVDFDKLYYESETYLLGKDVVDEGLKKGTFFKKEDGSVWCDLTEDGLDEKLVLRSDGTAVYMTQDIGTAIERLRDYEQLSGMIYTVGNEQDYHFKVLFLILKKLGYKWAEECYHLSYGMVDLPTGKMKSREGTVVDADDLMNDVILEAKSLTQERGHIEGLTDEEKNILYNTIGMGGLKYYLLKVDPRKRMMFNPEESIDLNGNTGPFIQYAHARIQSLLRKQTAQSSVSTDLQLSDQELFLLKSILEFPEVIKAAGTEFSPALVANYTYELVKAFNSFYQAVPIFKEENEALLNFRLSMSAKVGEVVKIAMQVLGVNVPDRM